MAQALLERKIPHAALEHARRVRVPEGVRGDPGSTNIETLAVPLKEFHESSIAQRFIASFSSAPNKKHVGRGGVRWALVHHVVTDSLQGLSFKEIHHPLCSRFGPGPLWVFCAIADDHSPARVRDIFELKVEHFAWAQPAVEHQQKHGLVSFLRERGQQLADLLVAHRTRNTPDRFDVDRPSDGALMTCTPHERTVTFSHPGEGRVIDLLNGILAARERSRENQIFVEGGNGSKGPIDRGSRKAGRGSSLLSRCREHQTQALCSLAAREYAEVF